MKVIPFISKSILELSANSYFLIDEQNRAIVIDPSFEGREAIDFLKNNHLTLKAILLTHGHFDHIRGVNILLKEYNVPVYIGEEDEEFLTNPTLNCSDRFSRKNITLKAEPILIKDGDSINVLSESIFVIATPYHTEGSKCFYLKDSDILFSGDSLFKESVGRSDFSTSSPHKMKDSLKKLMSLPKETKVYPGHNEETTIEHEQKLNPFVKI